MTEEPIAPLAIIENPDPPVPAASRENPAPLAPEAAQPPHQHRGPRLGDMIEYRGYESGGSSEHPAIVTGLNEDGSVDLTVFFRRSAPAALSGAVEGEDGYFTVPAKE